MKSGPGQVRVDDEMPLEERRFETLWPLTDGRRVSKRQFIGRVAELAGLKPPRRKIPLWLARTLATLMERRAKRQGKSEPPLVNKARYNFLGLNLDYSIEKARRVLGYSPPYTTEQGLVESIADLVPSSSPKAEAISAS